MHPNPLLPNSRPHRPNSQNDKNRDPGGLIPQPQAKPGRPTRLHHIQQRIRAKPQKRPRNDRRARRKRLERVLTVDLAEIGSGREVVGGRGLGDGEDAVVELFEIGGGVLDGEDDVPLFEFELPAVGEVLDYSFA